MAERREEVYVVVAWGAPFIGPVECSWISLLYPFTLKPSSLFSVSAWYSQGPALPLEFSRICQDKSLGAVIDFANGVPQSVQWATITFHTETPALDVLCDAFHYDASQRQCIGFLDAKSEGKLESSAALGSHLIQAWQHAHKQQFPSHYRGVLWNAMAPNFENFSLANAVEYLRASPQALSFQRRILNSEISTPLQEQIVPIIKKSLRATDGTVTATMKFYSTLTESLQIVKEKILKKTYVGNGYIEYIEGNLPIILSAPHGGSIRPSEIPDRKRGVIDGDIKSAELAVNIFAYLSKACSSKTKARIPHLIICHLHRIKLDANRNLEDAAQGDPYAGEAWNQYHDFITLAKIKVISQYSQGHYFDIHGNNMNPKVMLGYFLQKGDFDKGPNHIIENISKCSIRALLEQKQTKEEKLEVMLGPQSLASLLEKEGYPAVPVGFAPYDWGAKEYWNGGYNTKRHSPITACYPINSTQVETPLSYRRKAVARQGFAHALSNSILKFFQVHYNIQLTSH